MSRPAGQGAGPTGKPERRRLYEHRGQPLLSRARFLRRVAAHVVVSMAFVAGSLLIGTLGYVHYEGLAWLDAFLNASMLLGGMGPLENPVTRGGKLFASFYALYSGLVFLVAAGIVFAPVFHRLMHRFHVDEDA